MGWVEEQVRRIGEAEEQVRLEQAWRLHVNEVVKTEAADVFEKVAEHLEHFVGAFNAARGADSIRCERAPGHVSLTKEMRPSVHLRLNLQSNIVYLYRRKIVNGFDAHDQEGKLEYSVDRRDTVYLGGTADLESLAQRLFQPFIDAFMPSSR